MPRHRLVLVCLAVSCLALVCCQDYEERPSPLSRARAPRGPLTNSRAQKQTTQKTTSTTEAPPEEEFEYEDELVEEEPQTTTTTEPPRKGIRGGVLRPFRSNTDLIEALKRRRAQAQNGGSSGPAGGSSSSGSGSSSTTTTQSPEQGGRQGRKNKWNRTGSSTTEQPAEEQPAPRARAQFARGRRF